MCFHLNKNKWSLGLFCQIVGQKTGSWTISCPKLVKTPDPRFWIKCATTLKLLKNCTSSIPSICCCPLQIIDLTGKVSPGFPKLSCWASAVALGTVNIILKMTWNNLRSMAPWADHFTRLKSSICLQLGIVWLLLDFWDFKGELWAIFQVRWKTSIFWFHWNKCLDIPNRNIGFNFLKTKTIYRRYPRFWSDTRSVFLI